MRTIKHLALGLLLCCAIFTKAQTPLLENSTDIIDPPLQGMLLGEEMDGENIMKMAMTLSMKQKTGIVR